MNLLKTEPNLQHQYDTEAWAMFLSYAVFSPSPIPTLQLFNVTPHLQLSWLNSAWALYLIVIQVALFFYLSFYLFSVLSCHSIPFIISTTSCFILWSFFVPCVPSHHSYSLHVNILCMWILCALLHPSLSSPYYSLWYSLHFILLLSPSLWLLHICLTPYIISWSPVLVL